MEMSIGISKQVILYIDYPRSLSIYNNIFPTKGGEEFLGLGYVSTSSMDCTISRFVLFKSKQAIIELLLLYMFYLSLKNRKSYLFHFGVFFLIAVFLIPALESI